MFGLFPCLCNVQFPGVLLYKIHGLEGLTAAKHKTAFHALRSQQWSFVAGEELSALEARASLRVVFISIGGKDGMSKIKCLRFFLY